MIYTDGNHEVFGFLTKNKLYGIITSSPDNVYGSIIFISSDRYVMENSKLQRWHRKNRTTINLK